MIFFFFPNRNEDRKIALLNLLSVKGLLGIFSMWRKIRKSPWNFCQAVEVRDSYHTPTGLVNSYQGFRGGRTVFPLQKGKQVKHGKTKLTLRSTTLLSNVNPSVSDHGRGLSLCANGCSSQQFSARWVL